MKRLDSDRTYESNSVLESCETMVQQAGSRMESIWARFRDRRPSPFGSVNMGGSENVISSRFSKPSKPMAETAIAAMEQYQKMRSKMANCKISTKLTVLTEEKKNKKKRFYVVRRKCKSIVAEISYSTEESMFL